ncbi:DNA-processing protein DprA [Curvibacter sp. RS43]|uniref:DNA-processing protein DprA n=1 Tax=Curvibacter microcysteis TaxID=3026419 RepID=UPI0023602999|nr:DNA-processing protein DprA [Curvibacter sp. RS43]MDD0810889.1 DNA-processing protein DprA [Curvibacter sp. RS43]
MPQALPSREELSAWLRLTLSPGLGKQSAYRLLSTFGLPEGLFEQSSAALSPLLSPAQIRSLHTVPETLPELLERTWRWLQAPAPGLRHRVLSLADPDYPSALLALDDPPLLLYLIDAAAPPAAPTPAGPEAPSTWGRGAQALAMVGSRAASPQGLETAQAFAQALATQGVTIVSGLALGIDGAAHQGALAVPDPTPHWPTLAVVGTGLDRVYPRQHQALAHQIAQRGLLLSEYPLGTPPLPGNFPQRNRLIAALSQGTLVVEAALASGSLVTARLAAEQGREVLAIPGSIHAPHSRGCHALIRQGAKLVETVQDIVEEMPWQTLAPRVQTRSAPARSRANAAAARARHDPQPQAMPNTERPATDTPAEPTASRAMPHDPDALLAALGHGPSSLDALQARSGLPTPELQARLLTLELDGQVARLPGGLFQRVGLA